MDGRTKGIARLAVASILLPVLGCGSPDADVTAAELRAVVERDAVAFSIEAIPASITDLLADRRVVVLGETHHLREHWQFVASLTSELYDHGFRQLLIESPHMAGWLLDDYVRGSPLVPEWTAPPFYQRRLAAIRELNRSHPDDPIRVAAIDANEDVYGGASDFHLLLGWFVDTLESPGPTEPILGMGYPDAAPDEQRRAVEDVLDALEAERAALVDSWGDDAYDQLLELLSVELASIDVRAARAADDDRGARLREDVIKFLADERIGGCDCGTVINIGGHHAQKSHLMGTEQEWLGDHLAHASEVVGGSVTVIGVTSARTELDAGAEGEPWDVLDSSSPDHELRRTIAENLRGETVFMPLQDPLFAERTVAYNSEDVIHVTRLAEQFDALIQYGLAHRMPVD